MYSVYTYGVAKRQTRGSYHHGDLRQACINQGLALLISDGKDAVSLREIGRRCRVSPRAPYRHFKDKTAFLAVLAETGFAQFGAALANVQQKLEGCPAATRLLALARAYIAF